MEPYMIVMGAYMAYFIIKTLLVNDLSAGKASTLLKEGAVVVDVRTEEEYEAAHLKKAINIPLSEISSGIERIVPDRNRVVLLYCRSGSRSFMGKRLLKRMQYHNVYNLGSFGRARRMAGNENNN